MGECFDEGLAEGESEESICARLGSPEEAAAELLKKHGDDHIETVAVRETLIKTALAMIASVFLTVLYIRLLAYNSYHDAGRTLFALPLLPVMIWALFGRSKALKSLTKLPADGFMTAAAAFLALSGFTSGGLLSEAYRSADSYDMVYMLLTAVFIIMSMMLWEISMIKRKQKVFLLLPLAGICFALLAAAVSSWFFDAKSIGFGFVSYEEYKSIYTGYIGKYCINFLMIIVFSALAMLIYTNISRDAFTLPSSEMLLGVFSAVYNLQFYLRRLDPMAIYDVSSLNIDNRGIVIGMGAGIITLAAIVILRIRNKKEAA